MGDEAPSWVIASVIEDPSAIETSLLLAVKGPIVVGVVGAYRAPPVDGTGFGIASLNARGPVGVEEGVAPVTARVAVVVPVIVFPSAPADWTTLAGMASCS
jgi:hypothetical protein